MRPTRRRFLKSSLGAATLLSLGAAPPVFLGRSAAFAGSRRGENSTALVMVQLAGGNDGLNTVVPYADDEYARNRPTLRLSGKQVHRIDDLLGFHPQMAAFMRLYEEEVLSVVQGVGYPNPEQGHFGAMRNWQTARPGVRTCQTGWLGRTVDRSHSTGETGVPAIYVGEIKQPFTLNAERSVVPSIRSLEDCVLKGFPGGEDDRVTRRRLAALADAPRGGNDPLLDFMQRCARSAYAGSRAVEEIIESGRTRAKYPDFPFARMLATVAGLIRADLGIRIYYTELGGAEPGGFDTHANQAANHGALLSQLAEAIAAFTADLKRDRLLDRVLLMTFSEFGRTIAENGRRGTGHASAAPMFLVGGKVKGGLIGPHPSLSELENGGLKFHTDFRRIYATALDRWLGFDSRAILGGRFEPVDVLKD